MLDTEVTNYTMVNSGYDGVFDDYLVPDALSQFMAEATAANPAGGAGQQYFNCEYSSKDQTFSQACPIPVRNSGYLTKSLKIISSSIYVLTFRFFSGKLFFTWAPGP